MPLLWLSLAYLVGILLAAQFSWGISTWIWLVILAGAWSALPRLQALLRRRAPGLGHSLGLYFPPAFGQIFAWLGAQQARWLAPLPLVVLVVVSALGAARYQAEQPDWTAPDFIGFYNDSASSYVVEGVLSAPPDERDTGSYLRIAVERLHPAGELLFTPVSGRLLAVVPPSGGWRYGDRLRLTGELVTPFENEEFSYRAYLARQGVFSYMAYPHAQLLERAQGSAWLRAIYALRRRALAVVYQLYPDPEASLLAGILLGVESGIPPDLEQAFRDTGTAHIIAISGFNITILAALFTYLFLRLLGRRRRFLAAGLSALAIGLYTILVGADAAVVRAALMGWLALLARQVGRRQTGVNSLAFVAALMALWEPQVLWDVGFQLSFTATLGLVLYAEPFSAAFTRWAGRWLPAASAQRLAGPVGEYFLFTLAAQLATLPVTLYHFRRLSLVSLLANPLILPAQPAVMILGGLAVLLGLAYLPAGQAAAYLALPFVVYTNRMVEWLARLPGVVWELGDFSLLAALAFYALLLGLTFGYGPLKSWWQARIGGAAPVERRLPLWSLAGLLALVLLAWRGVYSAPDGQLHLYVLEVGSGQGLLVASPTGRYVLLDGGPSASRLSDALGRRLPLGQRELDYLVVGNPSEAQVQALPAVLLRYPPGAVLWAGPTHGNRAARALQEQLAELRLEAIPAQPGQRLDLGGGAELQVLAVGPRGAVLLLEWGSFRALLPLGLDFDTLAALQEDASLGPVTALLLAESGYAPANPPEWVAKLRPQVVLLSVAADDYEGLPSAETLQAVAGYPLLRTDRNGWVELITDGEQLWAEVERK